MMSRKAQRTLPNGLKLGRGKRVSACRQSDIVALLEEGFSGYETERPVRQRVLEARPP